MIDVAAKMREVGDAEYSQHAEELVGAAGQVFDWSEAISEEEGPPAGGP